MDKRGGKKLFEYTPSVTKVTEVRNTNTGNTDKKLTYQFNANVLNKNLIDNLPYDCCVEVPALACREGIRSMHVGPLPAHLAILVNTTARIEDMVADAAVTGDRRAVFQAVCMDPLTSAVCSLEVIKRMTDALFEKNRDYLPAFFKKA